LRAAYAQNASLQAARTIIGVRERSSVTASIGMASGDNDHPGRAGSLRQVLLGLDRSHVDAVLTGRPRSRVATVLGIPIDVLDDTMPTRWPP